MAASLIRSISRISRNRPGSRGRKGMDGNQAKTEKRVTGIPALARIHGLVPQPERSHPALRDVSKSFLANLASVLAYCDSASRGCFLRAELWRVGDRGGNQSCLWLDCCVGPGPLHVSGQADLRLDG